MHKLDGITQSVWLCHCTNEHFPYILRLRQIPWSNLKATLMMYTVCSFLAGSIWFPISLISFHIPIGTFPILRHFFFFLHWNAYVFKTTWPLSKTDVLNTKMSIEKHVCYGHLIHLKVWCSITNCISWFLCLSLCADGLSFGMFYDSLTLSVLVSYL